MNTTNWDIREEASGHWKREWVHEIKTPPPRTEFVKLVRAWDFASNLPSAALPSPDYTASCLMGKTKSGDFIILEITRTRVRPGDWITHVLEHANRDGKDVDILIPSDPGAQAKAATMYQLLQPLNSAGFYAVFEKTNQKKLERFRPFAAASFNGLVQILDNCGVDYWNKVNNDNSFFYKELEAFTGERKRGELGHDDNVDTIGSAFMYLAQQNVVPSGILTGLKNINMKNQSPLLGIK